MGRAPCCEKVGLNRGAWTREEDAKLMQYIEAHGEGSWRTLPKAAGLLRCGKSCRLRWINYLRPDLKRGNISEEEDNLIIKLHSVLGNRWSLIAGRLPGRTDNEIKNYWNTHLKKKLKGMGIDPNTHQTLIMVPSTSPFHNVSPPTSSNAHHKALISYTSKPNNNDIVMPAVCMRKFNQLAHEKSRMLIKSSSIIDKYEIDRFLSSSSAATSSVISSSNFDYKAKPMFSLECSSTSGTSDGCAAATALVRAGSSSSFINIQARRTAAPALVGVSASSAPTCCSSRSSSSSISSSPISKNPCAGEHAQYPYTSPPRVFSQNALSEYQASIQAFTQSPSSVQAPISNTPFIQNIPAKNPSPISAYCNNNPSPAQPFVLSSVHEAYTKNSSPTRTFMENPSSENTPLSAFDVRPNMAAYKLLSSVEGADLVNSWTPAGASGETIPKSQSALERAFSKMSATMGNASPSLVISNACTAVVTPPAGAGYASTICDYSDVITSQALSAQPVVAMSHHDEAHRHPLRLISLEVGTHELSVMEIKEGAESNADKSMGEADTISPSSAGVMELGLLDSSDVMWDFDMGLRQSLEEEEEGHNIVPITPTGHQELLQALWGPATTSNSWLHIQSELQQQTQKLHDNG